ncbi:hypothetical protein O0L34_g18457 [Tuta absoluta]|nr:hypothetical protein O0L34_g18457 [Tuta absoluta]
MLYLQQIERLNAKGEEHKLLENKPYGGAVFRRVCALLSLHDVKGAVAALTQHKLYKEAYVLSRARYRHMCVCREQAVRRRGVPARVRPAEPARREGRRGRAHATQALQGGLQNKPYGGAVFRRVCALLSLHDVKGAVAALTQHKLYKEAYVLSRARYMDSLATAVLREWAQCALVTCQWNLSAICHIALGDLGAAADALSKSSDEGSLSLAADIASSLGHHTFAAHVHGKREQIKTIRDQEQLADKELKELPNKVDALLNALKTDNRTDVNNQVNGSKHETNNNEAKEVQGDEMDEDIKKIEDEAIEMQDAAKELKSEAKEVEDEANELKDVVQEILEEVKQMKDLVKQEIKDVDKSIKNDLQSVKDTTIENVKNVSKDETKGLKDNVTEVPKIKEKTLRELLEQKLEDLEYDDEDATNKTELLVEKMERLMKQPSGAADGAGADAAIGAAVGAAGAHDAANGEDNKE